MKTLIKIFQWLAAIAIGAFFGWLIVMVLIKAFEPTIEANKAMQSGFKTLECYDDCDCYTCYLKKK